jgi:Peptidase family M23
VPSRKLNRWSAALAVTAVSTLLASSAAEAAGPRPFFQMPFACGQTWEASTYDGHWPDQDSIDLGEWTAADANMSQGEPVLASADGTVKKVFTNSGGEHRVYLDHGNGWVTHYIHLEQLPPLTEGQFVGQGEQIGRVGNSGAEEYHLHYTQLQDGKAVRIAFNGTLINTHAGQSPYSPWGNGEKLTSLNCPMNSFVQFNHQDGHRYQLAYKPGTGEVDIDRLNPGGATGVWGSTWTKGWTHFTPFTVGGKPHYFAYKSATGEVDFDRVNPGGLGATTIGEGTWSEGWTNFMPLSVGGQAYYVAYNSLYGGANLDRINAAGNGASTLWSGWWGKGWTHLMPFKLGGTQYFVAYKGGTGAVEIDKVTGGGNSVAITEVWAGNWGKGWSHLVPMTHNGGVHLLRYKSTTGLASFAKIKTGGLGIQTLGSASAARSWTTFSPFTAAGTGRFLAYKTGTGKVAVDKLNAAGTGIVPVWSAWWTLGWA